MTIYPNLRILCVFLSIRCVERNRIKCGTYWPQMPEESNEYGSYLVENIDQNVGKDFTINEFAITNTEVGRWICCFFCLIAYKGISVIQLCLRL